MVNSYANLDEAIEQVYVQAASLADEGVRNDVGGPFGAGVIRKANNGRYEIVTIDRNTVIASGDPTAHAEMNAIRHASQILNNKFLDDCVLVTTAKSCPMCLAAACWARIPEVYFSEDYEEATTGGFKDDAIALYIKGDNPGLIKEVQRKHSGCLVPFESWNAKENRVQY